MKTLLLIVFKIVEVALYLFTCYLFSFFFEWIGFFKLIDMLPLWGSIVLFVICVFIVIHWAVCNFPKWIALNKKWVNKILK